ncbi:MAG: mitochondrial fission ELM1 family protein [Rhodomicrobium sp.]|nr:mitochondrial fission ELM1 family protein [Rhodomicrobium sp.]
MTELSPGGHSAGLSWPHPLPSCWCVTDGRPGMENQAVGLAEAMGLTPSVKRVLLKTPWRILSPHITAFKRFAMSEKGDRLEAPWPDILIATGRPSILPSLFVKGQSGERTFTVQLQDPVSLRHRFNCIVVPAHDGLSGANVIVMDGALHRITPQRLAAEAPRWADAFSAIPQPRVSVLIGGNNSRYRLGEAEIQELAAQLRALSEQGWGLLITGSRRTGEANIEALRRALSGCAAFISDGGGNNPYFGMLAQADAFIVTCDSVNMISEACSTGKPVHVAMLPAQGRRGASERDKFSRFHRSLENSGRIRLFRGKIEAWTYQPLREMERAARLIQEAYLSR